MSVLRNSVVAAFCGALVLGSVACSDALTRVEVGFHQTVRAARTLEIHNAAGSLVIIPWNQDTVQIDARRRGPTLSDAQAIAINVLRIDSKVVITTDLGQGSSNRNVFYTIHAPANADLNLDEAAGNINVTGWTASVDVSQMAGNVDVTMARLDARQHVTLHSTTGNVVLTIPGASNATIDARAIVGSINGGDLGITEQRENLTGASAHGTIGRGTAPVELRVTTGAISLHRH